MTKDKRARTHDRAPTWTTLFVAALARQDDFMSAAQLRAATGANINQALATLHHLKNSRVVDSVESGGSLWWFLTGDDERSRTVDMRAVEEPGHRTKRAVVKEKRP